MTPNPAALVDQVVEQLGPMAGETSASFHAAADAFDAYSGLAPSAMHERIAIVIASECRTAAESHQVRRAFLQGFRL